jgi:hypothetical protein
MKAILLIPMVVLVLGCVPKEQDPMQRDEMPNDAMRVLKTSPKVPEPTAAMARRSGQSLAHLGDGYGLFMRKCSECHEPRVPTNSSDPNWHPTMIGMAWNAGLTKSEEGAMVDYLRAAER